MYIWIIFVCAYAKKMHFVGVITCVHTRECLHFWTCRDEIARDEIHTLILSVECRNMQDTQNMRSFSRNLFLKLILHLYTC